MAKAKLKLVIEEAARMELERAYRSASTSRDKEKLLAIRLATGGQHTYSELSEVVGRSRSIIQIWVERYLKNGLEGLLSRAPGGGRPSPLAETKVQQDLEAGLRAGKWRTAPQIRSWLKKEHGIERASKTIYYWLGKVGGALKVPRPVHLKKSTELSESFVQGLFERLEALEIPKQVPIKVWILDEHRYGLQPVQRRCWGWPGQRIVRKVHPRYQWGYVYGALECVQGQSEFLYTDGISQEATLEFYRQLQQSEPEAWHVLLADQAGFHIPDGDARLPKQVRVIPLPPYSPELNPVEKLWDILKDHIANEVFPSLEEIQNRISERLSSFWNNPNQVLQLVGSGWLHTQANTSY